MRSALRGMTFVDVIVGVSIMLVIFLAIFAAFQLAIELVYSTKAKTGGMSLVSQQLEYVRGLPYDSVGTVGGIPSGPIAQLATTSINRIQYTIRTLVLYVDAPQDGLDTADQTGITADYKLVKVEASWQIKGTARSTFAVTRISPHGVETISNGGILRINVFNAVAAPVADAQVRIRNASTSPAIDLTVESNSGGVVLVPGAPVASNYRITVSKNGYSSAQTYDLTAQNANPNPGNLSVVNKKTTTSSFAIDRTGTLKIFTYSPVTTGFFTDSFANQSKLSATTSTTVTSNTLRLATVDGGGYATAGTADSIAITPTLLAGWDTLTWTGTTPANTTRAVQLLYLSDGQYVLVPDAAVAGNSAGLTSGSVSLTALATTTYQSLKLRALLGSTNASTTPTMTNWRVDYRAGPTPLPNIGVTVRGAKTIGQTSGGASIYKYSSTVTTDATGSWQILPVEWDSYTLGLAATTYDISEQCPYPLAVQPGEDKQVSLNLVSHTNNGLRAVVSASSLPVSGATVSIAGSTNATTTSSTCGQSHFGSLATGTYTLRVSAPGYQTSVQNVSVSGQVVVPVTLSP